MTNFEDTFAPAQGKVQITILDHNEAPTVGKRPRRQRSHVGRAHTGGKGKKTRMPGNNLSSKNIPKGIPLFLQKIYDILSTCDEDIAGWTNDGKIFVIKDTNRFEKEIIPLYFNGKKFSSFERQLNFYRFCKIQDKPVRKVDIDISTAKYVKWYHENFRRDAPELLRYIKRSTAGIGNAFNFEEQQRQIDQLKEKVLSYERTVTQLTSKIDSMERGFSVLTQQLSQNKYHHDQSSDSAVQKTRQLSITLIHPDLSLVECYADANFSKPTLQDHPMIKKDPPSDNTCEILPISCSNQNRIPSRTSFSSFFRSLSVESNHLLDSYFGDNPFMQDEKEIGRNKKETVVTYSQNVTGESSLERINTEEIDQISNF